MADTRYAANSKKAGSVTRLPGWILKIKGRLDSRKGEGVCDEYIRRFYKKLAAMESKEVIDAENRLAGVRAEAAVILVRFMEQSRFLTGIVRLTAINENILSTDMILDERINEMRSKATEKVHAYITGVRGGKLSDYEYDTAEISDNAQAIYRQRHEELDGRIREAIGFGMNKEDVA